MRAHGDRNIYLIGFSGTGKSEVGILLSAALGYGFEDVDARIARRAGKSIAAIFAAEGEAEFRRLESEELSAVAGMRRTVVATGGGVVLGEHNRKLMAQSGWVICLEASPETILARLHKGEGQSVPEKRRPLLEDDDPIQAITSLKQRRQQLYASADWTVHTDRLSEAEVAAEIRRAVEVLDGTEGCRWPDAGQAESLATREDLSVVHVSTTSATYDVVIGGDLLSSLPAALQDILTGQRRAFVVSDTNVAPLYLPALQSAFRTMGWATHTHVVQAGEEAKTLGNAAAIYDRLIQERGERGEPIVALGGGVVGDLAGFVASTFLRGVPLVQVPTSLLSMVDSSVGGKTAVNHLLAKNSIGTFYQPRLVLADTSTLRTLPGRQLSSGWAEVVKTAMIAEDGGALFELLEEESSRLPRAEDRVVEEIIRRCLAVKARVVAGDERETGKRIILNYGHTIGHAVEAATRYKRFLHGEAVAIGMQGAALIAQRLGMLDEQSVERQHRLLSALGLPLEITGASPSGLMAAMTLDKKNRGRSIRWVLPTGLGHVQVTADVPDKLVSEVLAELAR